MQKSLVNPGFPGKPGNRGCLNNQGYPGTLFFTITSGSTPVTLVFLRSLVMLGNFKKALETSKLRFVANVQKDLKAQYP